MSADPKISRCSVRIKYAADDGYRQEVFYSNQYMPADSPPEMPMSAALEELARLTALFGFEDKALEVFNGARQRVAEWRLTRDDDEDDPRVAAGRSTEAA